MLKGLAVGVLVGFLSLGSVKLLDQELSLDKRLFYGPVVDLKPLEYPKDFVYNLYDRLVVGPVVGESLGYGSFGFGWDF